ncbi:FimV/HubP family polar landmark protein [Undibacterium cyanobacteriorum]|uniref:FimV/HubP family polar landmark protein n=1 Tax=Undibacterium cyanobacteriorum TaxID=3073561 RepID=A0ABY9RE26_9BURK|nr:FimV/HubP family polar landmark protein [Undibacterium sp. 20NA77.5]WMW79123.1 FimV/HubP family polar landmark protein [Undibacterium sp. 20NA77.5]
MHKQKRLSTRLLGSKALKAAAFSSLLVFSNAYATGLGKLTVLSHLGQPLRAEIELTAPNKEEISSLVPKVASIEAFRQANIEFNPALLSLRFAVEPRGNGYIIRVTSTQPMNEPWIDFLLEMNASNGKLVREYTALLDPAEMAGTQSAQIVNPSTPNVVVKQVTPVARPLDNRPAAREESPNTPKKSAKVARQVAESPRGEHDYRVKPGDTLVKIAAANLNGVSLDQMLVSIYRANPQAFVGDNMNRLKAGQILTIPDADSAKATSNSEAHAIVQAHSADFSAYRNKLAGQVMAAPAEKGSANKQSSSGAITAKVKETPTATNEAIDKLKLSKVPAASAKAVAKGMTEEDRIAKDKALAEANARVKELEKNVNELNRLLAVPSKTAQASSSASAKLPEPKPAEVASKAHASASAAVPAPTPIEKASASASASASVPASASASVSASAKALEASASVASASASAPAKPKPKRPAPPPPPVEEPGFFDGINTYLIGGGLLLAITGGIGIYLSRRKKAAHQFEDSILTGSSLKANSMFGSTGGQSVDTNNSVFNSNFAPSASQLDANEVDPVAEADVYIAYGRDTQAEEILKEALRTQPDRHAVRLKLLEIYYGRKDLRSYEVYAGELYGMTHGEGEEWSQAASMGVALDPNNPLYAGASAPTESFNPANLSVPTQPLEDLEPDPILDSSLSEDMLESISIIDTAHALSDEFASSEVGGDLRASNAAESDDAVLDFDLDISDASEPESSSPADNSLEFAPTLPEIDAVSTVNKVVEEEPAPVIDFGSIDFDLGTDDDIKAEEPVLEVRQESAQAPSGADFDLDVPSLDFGKVDEVKATDVSESSALEFVMPEADGGVELEIPEASADGSSSDEISPYNAEMATKLDLAVAYQEIGDKEGARELLEEVLRGGSKDQVERARVMLEEIS